MYALADSQLKSQMVGSIVATFSDDPQNSAAKLSNVTQDTLLFDESAAVPRPDGDGSVSTYQELCSLASELNQPDLVYKFMNLASHHHLWNSRKGMAFGFAQILGLSTLRPHTC